MKNANTAQTAISDLVSTSEQSWNAYLDTFETETAIESTRTVIRWHRIAHEATHDKPDVEKLIDKLMDLLTDFVSSRKEKEDAFQEVYRTGSAEAVAALQEKARRLFVKGENSGEAGEILLYYLADRVLKYPQILCKYNLKTNPNVHVHGVDGIHVSIDPVTEDLCLHWGESKVYQDLAAAIRDCFSSLNEVLNKPADAKKDKRRDIELLRDNLELNSPAAEKFIRSYLDPKNPLSNKIRFCGVALIGFDLKDYDVFTSEIAQNKTNVISERTAKWSKKIREAVEGNNLVGITLDVFCIPFSSVEEFRDAFMGRFPS